MEGVVLKALFSIRHAGFAVPRALSSGGIWLNYMLSNCSSPVLLPYLPCAPGWASCIPCWPVTLCEGFFRVQ
ncbi:hypothetical protein AWB67_05885 [Caballeronia terrestris]|uniref:Uncharacterized protein n=1 Tax=Caballeronia terrestris TaxID=1226301 RepID=A0A158KKI8_9BURK|nr:hypothetical protein AWB67_05885 [Caballeronia terrestris]